MKQRTFVIDLETLGTRPGSVICTIGAVEIVLERETGINYTFYRRICINTALAAGLKVDGETVEWWYKQAPEAWIEALGPYSCSNPPIPRDPLVNVLTDLSTWLGPKPIVYGNGPSFDMGLLVAAFDAVALPVPWRYADERCLRTEKAAHERAGLEWVRVKPTLFHHALMDAKAEATELILNVFTKTEEAVNP